MAQRTEQPDDSNAAPAKAKPKAAPSRAQVRDRPQSRARAQAEARRQELRQQEAIAEKRQATARRQTNIFLTIALPILVFPAGLYTSLMALIKPKPDGPGKALAILGVVLALAVGTAEIGLYLTKSSPTSQDAGCSIAAPAIASFNEHYGADQGAISVGDVADNVSETQQSIVKFTTLLQSTEDTLKHADSVTSSQNLKTEDAAVEKNMSSAIRSLQGMTQDPSTVESALAGQAFTDLGSDQQEIDGACPTAGK